MEGGLRGALWCVIEFLSLPVLSGLRLSVWPSVLGADRQVNAWKDRLTSSFACRRHGQDAREVIPSTDELQLHQKQAWKTYVCGSAGVLHL